MDFKIPGLPHSIVKQAQSASVRELVQKIENHPNRHALQHDLRQNQSFNPFSPESKQMIREVGNIDLCELLETEPKAQCKVFLSYWNIGIVYCMCGHFLRKNFLRKKEGESAIRQEDDGPSFNSGVRHQERTTSQTPYRQGILFGQPVEEVQEEVLPGHIHDRFIRDETFRNRMIENGRDEDACRQWDALADDDHTHHLTHQDFYHYKRNWWLTSNKTGSNPVSLEHRSDFKQALSTLQQLKQKGI